jgi:hypothetical protein
MRASQHVVVGFVKALANRVAGHEPGVGSVFRLDRSLRSAKASSSFDWGKDVDVEERREWVSKSSGHSRRRRRAGRRMNRTEQNRRVFQRRASKQQLKRKRQRESRAARSVTSFVSIKIDTRAAGREGLDSTLPSQKYVIHSHLAFDPTSPVQQRRIAAARASHAMTHRKAAAAMRNPWPARTREGWNGEV